MAKVMVVEDDQFFSSLMVTRLRNEGYEVAVAYDGEAAIANAKTEHPDLILLDMVLPIKNGPEVMHGLAADNVTATIPVIVVSNISEEDSIKAMEQAGAKEYLIKADSTPDSIVAEVGKVLAGHAGEQQTANVA